MNFKPVVASLFALGLVSAPVMAAHEAKEHHKHQKHHELRARHQEHRGVRAERLSGEYSVQERYINTNSARSPVASFDWANRFHFSGIINVDGKFATRAPLGTVPGFHIHDNTSDLNVNNANLFVDVDVNRLVTGHVGIAYTSDSVNLWDLDVNTNFALTSFSDSVRGDKGALWANGRLGVDEAYITIRDFSQSPFYFRAGKMYVPFGDNSDTYPITRSLTQLLSQTRATAGQVGWVSNYGLYASVYVLAGAESSFRVSNREVELQIAEGDEREFEIPYTVVDNYGAHIGYCGGYDDIRYRFSASYINDIRDGEYLSSVQDLVRYSGDGDDRRRNGRHDRLGFGFHRSAAAALHGEAYYGPFGLTANYVGALHSLVSDRHHHGGNGGNEDRQSGGRRHGDNDSRVSAGDLTGTYNCNFWGYDTGLSVGYQRSWHANPLLPKWRGQGDISVCVLPHTTVTLEYHYDRDYGRNRGGLAGLLDDDAFSVRQEGGDDHHHHHHDNGTSTTALRLGVVF